MDDIIFFVTSKQLGITIKESGRDKTSQPDDYSNDVFNEDK
jgi:hypothetical protein